MARWTRRGFIKGTARAAGAAALGMSCGPASVTSGRPGTVGAGDPAALPLDGTWLFRTDPEERGEASGWQAPETPREGWDEVPVPSTWQVAGKTADYLGAAWYRREFEAPESWQGQVVRVEFEAVFHTAEVFVNGSKAGEHVGKGYTAFALDISALLVFGGRNTLAVRVGNAFAPAMLPRNNSYDWAPDGGITRPVRLIVTPPVYLEFIWIDAAPDSAATSAAVSVTAVVRNATDRPVTVDLGFRVVDGIGRPGSAGLFERPAGRDLRPDDAVLPPARGHARPAHALAFRPTASLSPRRLGPPKGKNGSRAVDDLRGPPDRGPGDGIPS